MSFERQLRLWDTNGNSNQQPGQAAAPADVVETDLRPRLLSILAGSAGPIELGELRRQLEHAGPYLDQDPQSNPVNALVKELRDAGRLLVTEPRFGEPLVSLAEDDTPQKEEGEIPPPAETAADVPEASHEPYSLDAFATFFRRLHAGELDAAALQGEFARLVATKDEFVAALQKTHDKRQLAARAWRFNCFDAKRNTKKKNAAHIAQAMQQVFCLKTSVRYDPMGGETYEQAIAKIVETLTDEEVTAYVAECQQEREAQQKAVENPETLQEFRAFLRERSEDELSAEQRSCFDRLQADQSRAERAARQKTTVEQIESDGVDGLALTIKQGYHDRQKIPLFIVQLSTRIDRGTFSELKIKAKQLGGWYSSFKKSDAGFQFKTQESADKFAGLLTGDADRSEELADRRTRKLERASDRFTELADNLESEAEEILAADGGKLKNTVRRAEMAASTRGQAYNMQAFARTIRNVAADLDNGQAVYLDGVRTKTQLATLAYVLRRGKTKRNQALDRLDNDEGGPFASYQRREQRDNRPLEPEDVLHVEYPYPAIYKRHLEEAAMKGATRSGAKQRSAKMKKWIAAAGDKDFIDFRQEYEIEALSDFLDRCKGVGIDVKWMESSLDDYKRLRRANIYTLPELRAALRELLPHLARRQEDDPVQKAEQDLIGKKLPGFFPTPKPIIYQMLDAAEIRDGDRVLEPSAGKGDILDVIAERHPEAKVTAVEQNRTLRDVLEAKGHDVTYDDFLQHDSQYERIVMNPPFEHLADIDHVRHAYDQLAPGGRLVAIMSAGPFFRQDAKTTEFRDWLDDLAGEHTELPDDAFQGVEAFRQTGVRTHLVVIDR